MMKKQEYGTPVVRAVGLRMRRIICLSPVSTPTLHEEDENPWADD